MSVQFPTSDNVDILLFSEGTYPYVKGGVSAWVLQPGQDVEEDV